MGLEVKTNWVRGWGTGALTLNPTELQTKAFMISDQPGVCIFYE